MNDACFTRYSSWDPSRPLSHGSGEPPTLIQFINMNEGVHYLGVYITGNCSTCPMETQLWDKALHYTSALQKHKGTIKKQALSTDPASYLHLCIPSWQHGCQIISLTGIIDSLLDILNKMGFHQNLPCCLVFMPKAAGSIDLHHLCYKMETQQILLLLWHLCAGTMLGKDITILIHIYQLLASILTPILIDTRPCSWVPCMLNKHHIQTQQDTWTSPPIWQHDTHIMEQLWN